MSFFRNYIFNLFILNHLATRQTAKYDCKPPMIYTDLWVAFKSHHRNILFFFRFSMHSWSCTWEAWPRQRRIASFFAMAHIWRDAFCSSKKVTFQRASPTKTSKLLFEHPRAQQLKSPSTTCFTSCKDATKEKKVCFDTTNEKASKILWSRMDSLWIWCRKSNEMAAIKNENKIGRALKILKEVCNNCMRVMW